MPLDLSQRCLPNRAIIRFLLKQMNIQIGRGAEALDERDRAGVGSAQFEARPLDQKAGNDAVDHLQQRRKQLRLGGKQKA